MKPTPTHLNPHVRELACIARDGWGVALRRTPIGVFCRLERSVYFRGGRRTGWWWRPTTRAAIHKLAHEAAHNPRRSYLTSTESDEEW